MENESQKGGISLNSVQKTNEEKNIFDRVAGGDLDIERYGFSIDREFGAVKIYMRHFASDVSVELEAILNRYTLILYTPKGKSIIADRYRCETQDQLDFLIRLGGVHILFGN
jgi:hypothetical protein